MEKLDRDIDKKLALALGWRRIYQESEDETNLLGDVIRRGIWMGRDAKNRERRVPMYQLHLDRLTLDFEALLREHDLAWSLTSLELVADAYVYFEHSGDWAGAASIERSRHEYPEARALAEAIWLALQPKLPLEES